MDLDLLLDRAVRWFTDDPGRCLSWPAVLMVAGTVVGVASPSTAKTLGLQPRKAEGLVGLVTAPFIHANFAHLAANLPPFLVLGALVLRPGSAHFLRVAPTLLFVQGLLLWAVGRNAAHVGMSGVIFGFLGYLLGLGWFVGTTENLVVAGACLLFYGGMLAGVAPARDGTSWEGHLLGLLSGLGLAWLEAT